MRCRFYLLGCSFEAEDQDKINDHENICEYKNLIDIFMQQNQYSQSQTPVTAIKYGPNTPTQFFDSQKLIQENYELKLEIASLKTQLEREQNTTSQLSETLNITTKLLSDKQSNLSNSSMNYNSIQNLSYSKKQDVDLELKRLNFSSTQNHLQQPKYLSQSKKQ